MRKKSKGREREILSENEGAGQGKRRRMDRLGLSRL